MIGGRKIVPEFIRDNREPNYAALKSADAAWEAGNLDFSEMEDYLAGLVQDQLQDDGLPYINGTQSPKISDSSSA